MQDIIFREYDIRGIVGTELPIDQVYTLARAIAFYCTQKIPVKKIAVGMDGRLHSQAIKKELCRGFTDSGIDVLFVGICPTPALYFSLFTKTVDAGVMITASHNGPAYNGFKICLRTSSVWGQEIQKIKQLYRQKAQINSPKSGSVTYESIAPDYINYLVNQFSHLKKLPLRAVIDCGNGAAGTVLPDLISAFEWPKVSLLYPEVDGNYPHHEADPTVAANMADVQKIVTTTDIEIGIGLDGDCDRMVPMTKDGFLVPGDQLLSIFARQVLNDNPGTAIVFDIKSSSALIELLTRWGAQPIMSPSGHSIIKDMMAKHNALLGGELSCHFFFKDRYFGYDDGIYAALRLIEIITNTRQSLTQLLAPLPKMFNTRELRLQCADAEKTAIICHLKTFLHNQPESSLITIDGVRVSFPFGWAIARASNTQSVISIRCESETKKGLNKIIDLLYAGLTPYLSAAATAELLGQKENECAK